MSQNVRDFMLIAVYFAAIAAGALAATWLGGRIIGGAIGWVLAFIGYSWVLGFFGSKIARLAKPKDEQTGSSEQHARQVSSEAAPSASPDEPSA